VTQADLRTLREMKDRAMRLYRDGDDSVANYIIYLSAAISALELVRRELSNG
jgi:hypothetical protein